MNRQLRLELNRAPALGRDEFVVSTPNAEAVRRLETWPAWHGGVMALSGPAGSGKTHLAQMWRAKAGAEQIASDASPADLATLAGRPMLMEDADRGDPELLFHLINMAGQPGGGLLVTSREPPGAWPASLADLRSRLNALPVAELGPPDDVILEGVLRKFFRERNIRPLNDVFPYLVRRMERSVPVALALVERLDEAADAQHRPVSRALARQVLEEGGETSDLFAS
jgi:chromosomal replication initiation ATPase DnaA